MNRDGNRVKVTEIAPFDNATTKVALAAIYEMYRAAGSRPNYLSIKFNINGTDYEVWIAPADGKSSFEVIEEVKQQREALLELCKLAYERMRDLPSLDYTDASMVKIVLEKLEAAITAATGETL